MMLVGLLVFMLLVLVSMVNSVHIMNTVVTLPWNLTAEWYVYNYQTSKDQTQAIPNYQASLRTRTQKSKPVSATNHLDWSINTTHTNGYIIVNSFEEQLESAVNDLYQLANVVSPWKMQIVEPFATRSFLGFPNLNKTSELLRFGDLFNLSMANQMFGECLGIDYPIIASFEEFAGQTWHLAKVKMLKFTHIGSEACLRSSEKEARIAANQVNDYLRHRTSTKVNYIRISNTNCVDIESRVNFKELFHSLIVDKGESNSNELEPEFNRMEWDHTRMESKTAIILPHWHGIRTTRDRFYYWDPDYTNKRCPVHTIECSNTVKKAAVSFSQSLNLQRPYLGVHIRLERLIQDGSQQPGFLKTCIDKLIAVVGALIEKYGLRPENIVVMRDYGRQGSATCEGKHQCKRVATQLKIEQRLMDLGAHMREYVPTDIRMHHSGFISTVDKELLSTADYLLVIGRGSFQRGVVDRFRAQHPSKGADRLYTLCSSVYGERLPDLDVNF